MATDSKRISGRELIYPGYVQSGKAQLCNGTEGILRKPNREPYPFSGGEISTPGHSPFYGFNYGIILYLLSRNPMSAINVSDLSFSFPEQKGVLQNISFSIHSTEKVGLLGATGSGKSTLLETIVGLREIEMGSIKIFGTTLLPGTLDEIRKNIGFCFQNPEHQLFMPTIFDEITFAPINYGFSKEAAGKKATELLEEFGLNDYGQRSVHELSGGQKRLLALASILSYDPRILILDEPTDGLDPGWRRKLADILKRRPEKTLLVSSHDIQWLVNVTERLLILSKGRILYELPSHEILLKPEVLETVGLPMGW